MSQRKAWNDAMKSAASASTLPHSMQQGKQKRRSDRKKKQDRRDKARKVADSISDDAEYRSALWMDALEGVDPSLAIIEDDEEYDVLDDLDENDDGGGGGGGNTSSGAGSKNKRKRRGGGSGAGSSSTSVSNKKSAVNAMLKRYKPRSLATIILEEANKEENNVVKEYLDAEARLLPKQQLPVRKFCPVTNLFGIYTEPKSGIPYANLRALEQIRERAPPWMVLNGTPAYWETVKSIREEE